jgi:hypothetical protein
MGIGNDMARAIRGTNEKRTPKGPPCRPMICDSHTDILQAARRIDRMVETTHNARGESHKNRKMKRSVNNQNCGPPGVSAETLRLLTIPVSRLTTSSTTTSWC